MKRLICFLLLVASVFSLTACDQNDTDEKSNFYYVRNEYIYGQEDGVMASEVRSIAEYSDAQEILQAYLSGPQDTTLASPFPYGIQIMEFLYKGETLHITLSTHIVTLSKAKQVLACTCFARTAIELTGVKAVYFQTDNTEFAYMDPILIDKDSILLYDDYDSVTPSERN